MMKDERKFLTSKTGLRTRSPHIEAKSQHAHINPEKKKYKVHGKADTLPAALDAARSKEVGRADTW